MPSNSVDETSTHVGSAGLLPQEIYDGTLSFWRSGVRRMLMSNLSWESEVIAKIQKRTRHPWLDQYFIYVSYLGVHTFFLTALPIFFFFDIADIGRGIVAVLSLGVYLSSFAKDLVCSPRPYVPPVTRLTLSNHHLEYGFPSTHSTNGVSVALYIYLLLINAPADSPTHRPEIFIPSCIILGLYAVSIVTSRIYCGMHSFTDVSFGIVLGAAISVFWWYCGPVIEELMLKNTEGWRTPLVMGIVLLLAINRFPEPVDDCPCFEDATAFASVHTGILFGTWHGRKYKMDGFSGFFTVTHEMPMLLKLLLALGKVVTGVLLVLGTRLVLKRLLQLALPPLFRFFAQVFTLPNRRWYTPATEYGTVPQDQERPGERGIYGRGIGRAIPSVVDLPSAIHEQNGNGTAYRLDPKREAMEGLKRRKVEGGEHGRSHEKHNQATFEVNVPGEKQIVKVRIEDDEVMHYDADVLTRAIVYFSIGLVVSELIPVGFEIVGWGVRF